MILDVNKIQEGECLAWVSSPVRTLPFEHRSIKLLKQNNKTIKQIAIQIT
jgi:hypothetical protein